jgi:hypothetical protein
MARLLISLLAVFFTVNNALAQDTDAIPLQPAMTLDRLAEIIFSLDPNAQSSGNSFQMVIQDIPVLIITDPRADRMRAMVPIRASEGMSPAEILRVMQANFDTALDARYAIAHGKLWGAFIHPLSALEKDEFISALGQTVNIAKTYGTLYSGGALSYGGGDSIPLQRQLIDELLKKGEDI